MAAMLSSTQGISHPLERLFQNKQEISIGRNPSNTIVLNAAISPEQPIPDSLVLQLSRHHARLAVRDGELQVIDNGTLNGTFINNLKIPERTWRVIKNGDMISLGGTNPLELDGQVLNNPWTFKVKKPEEFLAQYVDPSSFPNAETQPQAGGEGGGQQAREVYTFSAEPQRRATRAPAANVQTEVIDLTLLEDSPPRATTTRPKSATRKLMDLVPQQRESKRARSLTAAPSAPPPAAAAAAAPIAGNANNGAVTKGIIEELTCPICQELVVAAYSLVPCGHNFCGTCLASWLVTKQDCPNCRKPCTAPPVRQNAIDNVVSMTVAGLDETDKQTYEERKKQWEKEKTVSEKKLQDPSKFQGVGGSGYGRGRVMTTSSHHLAGMVSGMMGGMGGIPGLDYVLQGYRGGSSDAARAARMAAFQSDPALLAAMVHSSAVPSAARGGRNTEARMPPAQTPAVGEQRFRCQYNTGNERCLACSRANNTGMLMLGMSLPGLRSRSGRPQQVWDWYHFECFPQAAFRNARVVGFENIRQIAAADASRIRERLVR